ncbi:MAG: flagellar biosynthetic protein FliO [Proteobacteria bacterium]|nr:flagellar biosynthetic protein FliO [Pseudomonadota bacterium]
MTDSPRLALALTLAAIPAAAFGAAPPAPVAPVAAASGFAQVAASLLLIVGVIVALAWLATRLRLTPRAASSALRILADVPVGPKERVVLLKVGDGQALVGVGADGVRSLELLARPVELPSEPVTGAAFAERLKKLMAGSTRP